MSIFGPIFTAGRVEMAAMSTLREWMATYLAEMERQTGRPAGSLPQVRSWTTVNEFGRWPEESLPSVLLISAGLSAVPEKDGQGRYRATWGLAVAVVVSARDQASTRELAMVYSAAIRGCLMQRRSLGGVAAATEWIEERYDEIPAAHRTLAAGISGFEVQIDDVVTTHGGPASPAPPPDPQIPPGDWPTVREDGVTVTTETRGDA